MPPVRFALSGDEGDNLFAGHASGEGGRIDLVVTCLDEVGCFSQKEEIDFRPFGVCPVCSDYEGEDCVTI